MQDICRPELRIGFGNAIDGVDIGRFESCQDGQVESEVFSFSRVGNAPRVAWRITGDNTEPTLGFWNIRPGSGLLLV